MNSASIHMKTLILFGMLYSPFNGLDDFKNAIQTLKNNPFDFSVFKILKKIISKFLTKHDEINDAPAIIDDSEKSRYTTYLQDLSSIVKSLKKESSSIKIPDSFGNVMKSDELFSPISKFLDGVGQIKQKHTSLGMVYLEDEQRDLVKDNIRRLRDISSVLKLVKQKVEMIAGIHEARYDRSLSSTAHTAGLANGASDINKIIKDVNDPWIKEVIEDSGPLAKALRLFSSIGNAAISAETQFSSLPSDTRLIMRKIIKIEEHFVTSSDVDVDSLGTAIDKVLTCGVSSLGEPKNSNAMRELIGNTTELRRQLEPAMKLKAVPDFLTGNVDLLDETIKLTQIPKDNPKDEVHNMVNVLKNSQKYQKLVKNLQTFANSTLKNLDDLLQNSISPYADEVENLLPEIAKFQAQAAKSVQSLQCFHGIAGVESIPTTIKTLQQFRELKEKPFKKGSDIVGKVLKAKGEVEKLTGAIGSFKVSEESSNFLKKFKNSKDDFHSFGLATRGIAGLKKALGSQNLVDEIKNRLQLVTTEIQKIPKRARRSLPKNDFDNLQKLASLESELQKMLVDLETWRNGLSIEDSTKLEDYSIIYQKAGAVAGISVDLTQMSRSVEELEILTDDWKTKDSLQTLAIALDRLNVMGLKFSDYKKSFADSRNTLKKIETQFVSLKNKVAKSTSPSPIRNNQNGQNQPGTDNNRSSSVENTGENAGSSSTKWIIIGFTSAILIIICILAVFWWRGNLTYTKKPEKKKPKKADVKYDKMTIQTEADRRRQYMALTNRYLLDGKFSEREYLEVFKERSERAKKKQAESEEPVKPPAWKETPMVISKKTKKAKKESERKPVEVKDHEYNSMYGRCFVEGVYTILMNFQKEVLRSKAKTLKAITLLRFYQWIHQLSVISINETISDYYKSSYSFKLYKGLVPGTAVELKEKDRWRCGSSSEYINANFVTLLNGKRIILTISPIIPKGTFTGMLKSRTDGKFWYMVDQEGSDTIVMLGDFEENGKPACAQYIPLEKGDMVESFRYKITCKDKVVDEDVIVRTLEVVWPIDDWTEEDYVKRHELLRLEQSEKDWTVINYENNLVRHKVTHYQHTKFQEDSPPETTKGMIKIMKAIKDKNNVVVHCVDGASRCGVIPCARIFDQELAIRMENTNDYMGDISQSDVMSRVRRQRSKAVKYPMQLAYTMMLVADLNTAEMENPQQYEEFYKEHKEIRRAYLKALELDKEERAALEAGGKWHFSWKIEKKEEKKKEEAKKLKEKTSTKEKSKKSSKSSKKPKKAAFVAVDIQEEEPTQPDEEADMRTAQDFDPNHT